MIRELQTPCFAGSNLPLAVDFAVGDRLRCQECGRTFHQTPMDRIDPDRPMSAENFGGWKVVPERSWQYRPRWIVAIAFGAAVLAVAGAVLMDHRVAIGWLLVGVSVGVVLSDLALLIVSTVGSFETPGSYRRCDALRAAADDE